MKVGILGGSFDPIHNGHIYMAIQAYESLNLDEIWLIPAGHSPNKDENQMTDSSIRFELCKIAVQSYPYMKVLDIEMVSNEKSYTYKTLEKLKEEHSKDQFFFIMGADSLDYFDEWKFPERIAAKASIVVINRDEFTSAYLEEKARCIKEKFPATIIILSSPKMDVSSHEIRALIRENRNVSSYLDSSVLSYIKKEKLYTGE